MQLQVCVIAREAHTNRREEYHDGRLLLRKQASDKDVLAHGICLGLLLTRGG